MIDNSKKAAIVRSTYHPVVKQYMDILKAAFEISGFSVTDVTPNEKIDKKSFIVTDSPLIAIKYMLKGYKNHCVWYQGVAPEESYMTNHSRLRFRILSFIEKRVMKKAKILMFVSEEMKSFYEKKYKINLDSKSVIMPCFNEREIVESAFDDEKYSKNNFVYLGGLQAWQCFEQTVNLYSELEKRSALKTKIYVFTKEKEKAAETMKKYGVINYEIDFVNPEELSERIKGMKYGFVLREDNIVNNVATPTKFSNYLANGIIPIYSSAIKSFSSYDKKLRLGLVCDLEDIDNSIKTVINHMKENVTSAYVKEKCLEAFSDYYNGEAYTERIAEKIKFLNL